MPVSTWLANRADLLFFVDMGSSPAWLTSNQDLFLLCLCCCADSPLLPYTRGLAMPESGAVVEFPIGPSATPSLATRTAPTFLTSSSINNARASRLSNPFNAQLCALSLPTLIWRDIFIAAIPVLNVFLSTCPVEKESRSVERVVPRSLRGRLKSPTAQRLACRSVYAFFLPVFL